jgi:hypothetical protein
MSHHKRTEFFSLAPRRFCHFWPELIPTHFNSSVILIFLVFVHSNATILGDWSSDKFSAIFLLDTESSRPDFFVYSEANSLVSSNLEEIWKAQSALSTTENAMAFLTP